MQEEDYTFVTLDSDDAMLTDAVIVDVDGGNDLSDAVMIDESIDASDFITLSDDTIMLSDADMLDTYSTFTNNYISQFLFSFWIHIQPILTDLIYRLSYDFR